MIPRRGLLAGLGALLAAPAIIRTPGLLMPVRPVPLVMGVDLGRDEGTTLLFYPTPSGIEGSVFWRFYMAELAKRRIHPFEGKDGPIYVALRGEGA